MASRASYVLRVGGRLKGTRDNYSPIVGEMQEFFKQQPASNKIVARDNKPGPHWPDGILLHDYEMCTWDFKAEEEYKDYKEYAATVISFRAEAHHILNGTLYTNRSVMIPDVQWFYHSPEYQWHMDLKKKLQEWNEKIGQEKMFCWIWFHEWQWYCGNGGGT